MPPFRRRGRLLGDTWGFVVSPGFEAALTGELAGVPLRGPRWPGLVTGAAEAFESGEPLDPAFSRQQLPGALLVKGDSARALADRAYAAVEPTLETRRSLVSGGELRVHVYVPDPRAYRTLAAEARVVEGAFEALVGRPSGRRPASPPDGRWDETVLLVQLAVVARTSVVVSVASPRALAAGGFDLAPWPAGRAPVPEDRAAPSRAYRKLVEAWAWLGAAPRAGEVCVDLGGAPGGWAFAAASRRARVFAIDRAPLAPAVAQHPAVTAIRGNAFTYAPPEPVDWLLCDVICEPHRTIELVSRWMERAWCRRVVATLKFKGHARYDAVDVARAALSRFGWPWLRIKQLSHHHNEVAILARVDAPAAS